VGLIVTRRVKVPTDIFLECGTEAERSICREKQRSVFPGGGEGPSFN